MIRRHGAGSSVAVLLGVATVVGVALMNSPENTLRTQCKRAHMKGQVESVEACANPGRAAGTLSASGVVAADSVPITGSPDGPNGPERKRQDSDERGENTEHGQTTGVGERAGVSGAFITGGGATNREVRAVARRITRSTGCASGCFRIAVLFPRRRCGNCRHGSAGY